MTEYEMISKALGIAQNMHQGMVDKAGKEYIFHPVMVALQCRTAEEKCAALLHDTVEDTELTLDDIASFGFPESVVQAVGLLTHVSDPSDPDDYMHYVQRIAESGSTIAVNVKIADLTHNTDLSRMNGAKTKKYETYVKALQYLMQFREGEHSI